MNYGDPSQQQYYIQQRITPHQQRMQMQMSGQPQQGHPMMVAQQQQQPIRSMYGMVHQQQGPMVVRMQQEEPVGMPVVSSASQYQHQMYVKELLHSFPPNIQAQISTEKDPEKRRQLFSSALQRQQVLEHQQQGMLSNEMSVRMPSMNFQQGQRIPMGQQGGGGMYAAQPMMAQQTGPIPMQRISSQGSFGQPSPAGQQPVVSQSQAQQGMQHAYQQQMGAVRAQQTQNSQPAQMGQPHPYTTQQQHFLQQQQQAQAQQQQMHKYQAMAGGPAAVQVHQTHHPAVSSGEETQAMAQVQEMMGQQASAQGPQTTQSQQFQSGLSQAASLNAPHSQPQRVETPSAVSMGGVRSVGPASDQPQQPNSVGPSSVNTLLSQHQQQAVIDTESSDYKGLFNQLKSYHADVKRLLARIELDNTDKEKDLRLRSSLTNVIQVMEGTRKGGPVKKELVQRLLSNVQFVVDKYNISKPLLNAVRELSKLTATNKDISFVKEQLLFSDSWESVRHLHIKVPEKLSNLESFPEDFTKGKNADPQKPVFVLNGSRKRSFMADKGRPKRSLLENIAKSLGSADKRDGINEKKFEQIRCMDGTELTLNPALTAALQNAIKMGYSIIFEEDKKPLSSRASSFIVRLLYENEHKKNSCGLNPPLDLLLPVDYPNSAIHLLAGNSSAAQKFECFQEKFDARLVDLHSLESVLEGWEECLLWDDEDEDEIREV